MRKSDFDFSLPNRQSWVAILFLAYNFFKIIIRQIWPLAIAVLIGRENIRDILLWSLTGIGIVVFVFAVISFFRYYFYIENDELIVVKGVFKRSRTNIPFPRIQTINIEQSILHQVFRVAKLEVDTAGSKDTEFSFSALSLPKAEALQQLVLKQKTNPEPALSDEGIILESAFKPAEKKIFQLTLSELIRIGATQNHLRSLFIILAFFMTLYNQVEEVGVDAEEMVDIVNEEMIQFGRIAIVSLAIISLLISFAFSMIRTIVRHYDFTLFRTADGFRITSGLFTKKQIAAKDHKIQYIAWADNPLKRMLGIFDVFMKQVSGSTLNNARSIIIPGCSSKHLERIKSHYINPAACENLQNFKISEKIVYFRLFYFGLIPSLIAAVILVLTKLTFLLMILPLWPLLIYLASKVNHKKWNFAINDQVIFIHYGIFGNYHKALKLYKIQSISLQQSLYQKRNHLANIIIYTASGSISIPFVPLLQAQSICNFFLYKIESDTRKWM